MAPSSRPGFRRPNQNSEQGGRRPRVAGLRKRDAKTTSDEDEAQQHAAEEQSETGDSAAAGESATAEASTSDSSAASGSTSADSSVKSATTAGSATTGESAESGKSDSSGDSGETPAAGSPAAEPQADAKDSSAAESAAAEPAQPTGRGKRKGTRVGDAPTESTRARPTASTNSTAGSSSTTGSSSTDNAAGSTDAASAAGSTDTASAASTATATVADREDGKPDAGSGASDSGEAGEKGGLLHDQRAWFLGMLALSVVFALLAALFGANALGLTGGSQSNEALVDKAATSEVNGQVDDAVSKVFSYDFANTGKTEDAANKVLVGRAVQQYHDLFATVKQQAPQQKLVVTTTVKSSGVTRLQGDQAQVLVFVDQNATRTTTGENNVGPAQISIGVVKQGDQWKINSITQR